MIWPRLLSRDLTSIIVIKEATSTVWDDFTNDLPERECRWAVYGRGVETGKGKGDNMGFFSYMLAHRFPDDAKVKEKMLFSSSTEALRIHIDGVTSDIQATDSIDIDYERVLEKAKESQR